jgi:exocyst complex component 6
MLKQNAIWFSLIFRAQVETQFVSRTGPPAMFRVARADAEQQISEKLQRKLDEFMELENYDWMLGEPQGHASSHITDMIAYLQSTLQAFTNLPVSCTLLLSNII